MKDKSKSQATASDQKEALEQFDVDRFGVNGIQYDPTWCFSGLLGSLFESSVNRVRIVLPLGVDFPIYLVSGHDDEGAPQLWITLSQVEMLLLMQQFSNGRVHELRNLDLWRTSPPKKRRVKTDKPRKAT